MGSLNEFTIAHDEGKVIGCLTGTGGVADGADQLIQKFGKRTRARVFQNDDPEKLVDICLQAVLAGGGGLRTLVLDHSGWALVAEQSI